MSDHPAERHHQHFRDSVAAQDAADQIEVPDVGDLSYAELRADAENFRELGFQHARLRVAARMVAEWPSPKVRAKIVAGAESGHGVLIPRSVLRDLYRELGMLDD